MRFEKFLLLLLACGLTGSPASARPNVLLILVDDLRPALGAYGDKAAVTPNMDRLAARGLRCDLAYCNISVCAPSRFTLMTGCRPTTLGIYGFHSDFRRTFPSAVTLPQHFKNHGYQAEAIGKAYHFGHGCQDDAPSWSTPTRRDLVIEYLLPESTGGRLTREEALFSNARVDPKDQPLPRGAAWEAPEGGDDAHADGRTAAAAVRRLQAAKTNPGQPFFLVVGFARPHLPFSAPKKYWNLHDPARLPMPAFEQAPEGAPPFALKRGGEIENYSPIPAGKSAVPYPDSLKRQLIHGYYASTSYVDAQIGRVIAALDETGLADNTIVILWGDHGFLLGEMNSWTKHCNYELANHIPLLIIAPGVTTPGSSTRQLVETVDLYPTLAALAGLPAPPGPQPQDGLSLVPVLKNPDIRIRDHAFHCFPRPQGNRLGRAIRTEHHRLVEWLEIGGRREDAVLELYDYADGPVEKRNLAAEKPELVQKLRALLDRHPPPRRPGGNAR